MPSSSGLAGYPAFCSVRSLNASVSTMIVPPFGTSRTLALSAAGFIATRTSGRSPAVRMSWSAKCTWKPDTPGSEPAGARISAGKSGNVARSFPSIAVSLVKRSPVSCIPSPESPAKRMITPSRCSTRLGAHSPQGSERAGPRARPGRCRAPAIGPSRGAPHDPDAPRSAGREERVRVDLVDPPEEVAFGVVRRAALDGETRRGRCDARRRPSSSSRRRSASSAAGPSAYPLPMSASLVRPPRPGSTARRARRRRAGTRRSSASACRRTS